MTLPRHHGPRLRPVDVNRYEFKRLNGKEFLVLRKRANLTIRDVMFLTGRHHIEVAQFHEDPSLGPSKAPPRRATMADVMVLELIARNPANYDLAYEIANDYSLGHKDERGGTK